MNIGYYSLEKREVEMGWLGEENSSALETEDNWVDLEDSNLGPRLMQRPTVRPPKQKS